MGKSVGPFGRLFVFIRVHSWFIPPEIDARKCSRPARWMPSLVALTLLALSAGCQHFEGGGGPLSGTANAVSAASQRGLQLTLPSWLYYRPGEPRRFQPSPEAAAAASTTPFGWPVEDPARHVISLYGPRGRDFHNGIDIKAPRGTPIVATAAGTVTLSGRMHGYGNVVVVDHGAGMETLYAHLASCSVNEGEWVDAGQELGRLGSTGRVTTYHVHYEVHVNGEVVDPAPYLPLDAAGGAS